MTLQDLQGMAGMFLPMVAFAYLAAFMAAALVGRWPGGLPASLTASLPASLVARWRSSLYVLAGATAIVMIHVTLRLAFGLTPVAAARTAGGLVLQALAGGIGGLTYVYLARRHL
jgi:hypothetical protein